MIVYLIPVTLWVLLCNAAFLPDHRLDCPSVCLSVSLSVFPVALLPKVYLEAPGIGVTTTLYS